MAKTFYLIDGHAQIFRAYFAPFRELESPSGEPTKATYVFTQWLIQLINNRKPDYLAMVIDTGDESVFRKEIYPQYKANREARPIDLGPQENRILRIVRDAGIPIFAKPGYEADDLIATIAAKLCDKGYDIVLVSKDKDLRQLVNDCTRMYDIQKDEFTDAARMETDCGFSPHEAVEVQTLMGDSIDNVPGIPGVGEKTAAKLIKKYGRAEEILKHLDELTPKLRENFEKNASILSISRQLVTLKRDVEFAFDAEACRFDGLDPQTIRPHLEELGFTSLLKRLGIEAGAEGSNGGAPAGRPARPKAPPIQGGLFGHLEPETSAATGSPLCTSAECDYRLVDTEETFKAFLKELKAQERFAFDTETNALGAMKSDLIGLSFSWKEAAGFYVPVRGPVGCQLLDCDRVLQALRPILEEPAIKKVGHNIKYDALVMRRVGIELAGVEMDTMIAAFVLDASRMQYGIDALARDLLSFKKISTEEVIGKGRSQVPMDKIALDQVARYASEDADICWRLANLLREKLREIPALEKLNNGVETPLIDVLVEMELNGVAIDPRILKEQSQVLSERVADLKKQIMQAAKCDFNPDSPKQLAEVLFNHLGLRIIKKNKTGPSTDIEVLDKLSAEHPVPKLILEYRSLVKLKNTYLDNLTDYVSDRTGRIHASFNQTGAATGRLSCSDPNLQNIPIRTDEGRRIRLAFVPGVSPAHGVLGPSPGITSVHGVPVGLAFAGAVGRSTAADAGPTQAAQAVQNVLLTCDYSQIELRMLAHFTEEPPLVRAFEQDEDVHRTVAAEVFGVSLEQVTRIQRNHAKTINFGIIYGVSAYGLARRIEGLSVQAAQDLIDAYNKRFPSIKKFMDKCVMDAQSFGYVETILGRRRRIPELNSPVLAQRNAGERMAINSVVQGSAADLIKIAMLRVHNRLKKEKRLSKLLLQVHDELVFETPKDAVEEEAKMIREEMTAAMKLKVPLKVEAGWGANWQEGK